MASTPSTNPARSRKPKRPAHLAHGRWLGDLEPLSVAEKALVAACAKGEFWWPEQWDGKTRPDAATLANTIRADLIRFLLLGGDANHPVHELGVMVGGAWISDTLNVPRARCPVQLDLRHCHLVGTPILMAATLPELSLSGCALSGLRADGLIVTGDVNFRDGFSVSGELRLVGAEIGGDLACDGGSFTNTGGCALSASGLKVRGMVYLREGFIASGQVRLVGAEIGGDLVCSGGSFVNVGNDALSADGLKVKGSLFLRNATIKGAILLVAARIGNLVDDERCWEAGGHSLDGLHYDRIIGRTDAASRVAWLKMQHPDELTSDFAPQPWEQLIKVLREMGHSNDASKVAIAKQIQMRKANLIQGRVRGVMHWLYVTFADYGSRFGSIRTIYLMFFMYLFCGACFEIGREWGYFGPTNPLIYASAVFEKCGVAGEDKPFWTSAGCSLPPEYTTMSSLAYSLDLLLPLVNLQQDVDWAPIVINGEGEHLWFGYFLRALLWFEILFGWLGSLILVAVLGRLVDKD